GRAVIDVERTRFGKYTTTKGNGPGGNGRSIVTQHEANRTVAGGLSGGAGYLTEVIRRRWRAREAQLFQPGLVVVDHFHRAVGREAQALVIKRGMDALVKEAAIEVIAIFFGQAPGRIINVGIQVYQGIIQLVEGLVIL